MTHQAKVPQALHLPSQVPVHLGEGSFVPEVLSASP
jgi:hypothetical protein